ncbi:MAG: hypothetical protein ACRD5H_13205 [Nitrososphaerales archaeon]
MEISLILGVAASIASIALIVLDKRDGFNKSGAKYISQLGLSDDAAKRAFLTLKGFLLIFCLPLY